MSLISMNFLYTGNLRILTGRKAKRTSKNSNKFSVFHIKVNVTFQLNRLASISLKKAAFNMKVNSIGKTVIHMIVYPKSDTGSYLTVKAGTVD